MTYQEKEAALTRKAESTYYQERLKRVQEMQKKTLKSAVSVDEMPWETCQQGILKHMVNADMDTVEFTLDICMQLVPPGSKSGKHRHMAEEYMFILEGKGYSLHWDVDMELGDEYRWIVPEKPTKWEWERGDSVYIPPNTIHQHFNADPDNPLRFISAESRLFRYMGLDDLEQLENAPEWEDK